MLKGILTEYEEGTPFSFYFGASCHGFALKVFNVFDQTVTQIGALIMCTYLGYMRKDMSLPSISVLIECTVLVNKYFRPSPKESSSFTDRITLRDIESPQEELAPFDVSR